MQAEEGFYFIGKDISGLLEQKFQQLVGDQTASPQVVEVVMGRKLEVFFVYSLTDASTCSSRFCAEECFTWILLID